ncbi:MAG: HD domain-containing phosphohydrolase [Bacillota bacterium]
MQAAKMEQDMKMDRKSAKKKMDGELNVSMNSLLLSLSEILDIASPSVAQHHHRTAYIAYEIARSAGLERDKICDIFSAALLHDIGAISAQEKMALMRFETVDEHTHAIKGELLLKQVPWLEKLSPIIRNHHRKWADWDEDIKNPVVFASQVLYLSDYVERLIDRNRYILHQTEGIADSIKKLEGIEVNGEIIKYFIDVSVREGFWLDLVSPRINMVLSSCMPFGNATVGLEGVLLVSELYRNVIDFKSRFTSTHTSGVASCAEELSRMNGFSRNKTMMMRIAGNFHDVGKLAVPDSVLEKQGRLTAEEFAFIKCHAYYTHYIMSSIDGMEQVAKWASYHHERLDGCGYPFRCKADEIDEGSRIIAVADIYTALAEDRPYRPGMEKDRIYRIMKAQVAEGSIDKKYVDLLFDGYEDVSEHVREQQTAARKFFERFSRFRPLLAP